MLRKKDDIKAFNKLGTAVSIIKFNKLHCNKFLPLKPINLIKK